MTLRIDSIEYDACWLRARVAAERVPLRNSGPPWTHASNVPGPIVRWHTRSALARSTIVEQVSATIHLHHNEALVSTMRENATHGADNWGPLAKRAVY